MVYLPLTKKEIKEIVEQLVKEKFPVKTILEISFSPDNQSSLHSALILEALFLKDYALLDPILDDLFDKYNEIEYYATARTFGKLLTSIYKLRQNKKATSKMFKVTDGRYDDKIIEGCFKQIEDNDLKLSIAVWQLQLLTFFMNKKRKWIKEEVLVIINKIRKTDSPAVVAFTTKYLEKIKKL